MKVLLKFMITEMWTSNYTAQNQSLRIESIQNETQNNNLDNIDNPLKRNIVFGSGSSLA